MRRKYEIAVLSKGAFARTVKISSNNRADRAVIYCGGSSMEQLLARAKCARSRACIVTVEGTPVPSGYFPFDVADANGNKTAGDGKALISYILETVIPYLDKRFGFSSYALIGSGAAGLAVIYAATLKSPRITAYAAYSAPFFMSDGAFVPESGNVTPSDMFYIHVNADISGLDDKTQNAFVVSAADAYAKIRGCAKHCKLRIDFDADGAIEEFLSDFSRI